MYQKGLVIWLTGLPCSGKTTLAKEIEKWFIEKKAQIQRLDGDVIRETISKDLSFSKEDRNKNIERMAFVAQMLSNNGVHVVSAFVTPYKHMRQYTRSLCDHFIEVSVECNIDKCKERDVKGMYAQAQKGKIKNFTGVHDVFETSETPEIIVNTDIESVKESTQKIQSYVIEYCSRHNIIL